MATTDQVLFTEADSGRFELQAPDMNGLSLFIVEDDTHEVFVYLSDDDRQKLATMLMTDFVKGGDDDRR